jgi:hypothetical protein
MREITADDLDDLLEIWGDPETVRSFPHTLDSQAMREWIDIKPIYQGINFSHNYQN